jgi:hypothetical protein
MNNHLTAIETATQRLEQKKELAKIGMTVTLGLATITGFMRGRRAKTIHVWAGCGLIGFSLWHHYLYRPEVLEREIKAASQTATSV